jgi:hypothetical protein
MADKLKELQDKYLQQQLSKISIDKPKHVEKYDEKLRARKMPGAGRNPKY